MADKVCKKIKFPGLPDYYTFLQNDPTLKIAGAAADAKQTGDRLDVLDGAVETKAERDGYYQDMTVGDAEQLVSSQFVEDNAPYKFRTSGGSADIGNRAYVDKIVGGTIAWNQLAQTDITRTYNGITFTPSDDGYVINGTASGNAYIVLFANGSFVSGHRYLMFDDGNLSDYGFWINTEPQKATHAHFVTSGNLTLTVKDGVTVSNVKLHPQLFDLTQMFGSAVADAVYAMEQTTAGAGVAWFRSMFPDVYYPYNAGELISVGGLQSHDTVGFNLWDEVWEKGRYNAQGEPTTENGIRSKNFIRIPDGVTQLYVSIESMTTSDFRFCTFDSDKNLLTLFGWMTPNGVISFPKEVRYIKFFTAGSYGNTYKNDICINLPWSGTRNGEYQPYEKHSYPLDSSLTLRGIPKLSADNQLYFDGDEYLPSGKVNRRFGIVDLGTLTWTYRTTGLTYFYATGLGHKANGICICSKYLYVISDLFNIADKVCRVGGSESIQIKDSAYTDAATFKAAMSGVYLVYELETPTEETAEAYNEVQLVDDWGTEEYVSGTICPVGHETRYPANLRDKLQHLPDLAGSDGYYMIQQTGAQMSLVLFRIPQATGLPDGTYTLKATVSGGTPTYTWVNDNGEESGT